jgi:hypothetical protein
MKIRQMIFASAIALATLGVNAANAGVIPGLFNTDASLAADGATDPHWTVNGGAAIVYNHPAYLTYPTARFIAAQAGGGYTNPKNTYDLVFSMAGLNPLTASLSGVYAADNWGDAFLNGILLVQQPHQTIFPNFTALTAFSASGVDFINGLNTLEFVVTDTGPPSALLVAFTGSQASATAVPEPLTLSIFGVGVAGAAALRRRKKKSA